MIARAVLLASECLVSAEAPDRLGGANSRPVVLCGRVRPLRAPGRLSVRGTCRLCSQDSFISQIRSAGACLGPEPSARLDTRTLYSRHCLAARRHVAAVQKQFR